MPLLLLAQIACSKAPFAAPPRVATAASPLRACEELLFSAAPPSASYQVVIYGADWCGPCHQAAAFFTKRGVAYVERNVETDREAAREMRDKLDRAGVSAAGIPVLDVRGHIQVGFSARAVDFALRSL